MTAGGAPTPDPSPRARIERLADEGSVLEVGAAARSQQPVAVADTPADGLHTAFARVAGREVMVIAEAGAVLARTDGEVARAKRNRALGFAQSSGLPVVVLIDGPTSAPPTFGVDSGELHGRMADPRADADLRRRSGPLVAVVLGPAVGWSAEAVAEADIAIGVNAVAGAIEVDVTAPDEAGALERARAALVALDANSPSSASPASTGGGTDGPTPPAGAPAPAPMDPDHAAALLLDAGSLLAFERPGGSGLLTGLARVGGRSVAVAVTGGAGSPVLTAGDLRRLLRLFRASRRNRLPLVLVQDTAGYGPDAAAAGGLLADLAAERRAATVPVVCIVTGRGHVLGTFALGSRQLGADYVIAWPWARLAIVDPPSHAADLLEAVRQPDPWAAAGRGLVDDVLTPAETAVTLRRLLALLGDRREPT